MHPLLSSPLRVINIGLPAFARDLVAAGSTVVQVDWTPPAGGRPEYLAALSRLDAQAVDSANQAVLQKMLAADPVLADVARAGELIPALDAERLMLHAGPPIEWQRMCGPLRGAVCGAMSITSSASGSSRGSWVDTMTVRPWLVNERMSRNTVSTCT